ncbi:hypothetical protein L873DRAFT_1834491 [Choiromyces venosus 120613-1]|uniref:Uncharacterized protein n=1 Tax=Choiromyces venosus 120613-1 TaxID=1336337 RepID=A0A3N4JTS0_9PEZI|nr:hypothetical protein L873DRAFT_1834491 [Choiromyces venosus 120613-1]
MRVGSTTPVEADELLYHQLQNLERYPEALPVAKKRLLSAAIKKPTSECILSTKSYSSAAVKDFFQAFEAYLSRRRSGGPREILLNLEYAKYWPRTAAPVKYVDGAWLGGVHRLSTTLPRDRVSTRIAWQVLSEELVYQCLMQSINADIGFGDEERFVDQSRNPNTNQRVWKAAVSQLCVPLFPDEFLPEMLGLNMAYENLPLHLLITIQELRELKFDPYYFILHVSVDNSHSGHSAMGIRATTEYTDSLPPCERDTAWRRVQAGVILADGLPMTPTPPTPLDQTVETMIGEKATAARPIHAPCRAKIAWIRGTRDVPVNTERDGGAYIQFIGDGGAHIRDTIPLDLTTPLLPGEFDKTIYPSPKALTDLLSFPLLHPTPLPAPLSPALKSNILHLLSISSTSFEYAPSNITFSSTLRGVTALRILHAIHNFPEQTDLCAGMADVSASNSPARCRGIVEISRHHHTTTILLPPA